MLTSITLTRGFSRTRRQAAVIRSRPGRRRDVEEVRGRPAVELEDVHGGHRETGAVHHAADVAVEGDVVEPVARPVEPAFVLALAQILDVAVAEQGVVVDAHLRIEGEQRARPG